MNIAKRGEKVRKKNERKKLNKEKLKRRITEIDFIRGIAIIIMVFDHAMYDFKSILPSIFYDYPNKTQFTIDLAQFARKFWYWDVRIYTRFFILFLFLALTGISCSFSKNNLKRGVKLLVVALVITLVTYLFGKFTDDRQNTIVFGILHCISLTLIIISLCDLLLKRVKFAKWIYLALGVVLTTLGAYFTFINPGIKDVYYGSKPFSEILFKSMLGIYECGSDCYSLTFYGGQIFIGVFIGKQFYANRKSLIVKGDYKNNFITFAGRHSLIVYVAHQVVLPVLFSIILICFGFKLNI